MKNSILVFFIVMLSGCSTATTKTKIAPQSPPTLPTKIPLPTKPSLLKTLPKTYKLTMAWSPSQSSQVKGYNVYYGVKSRTYTNQINFGNVFTGSVSNLVPGVYYFFSATAYDSLGMESDFSNEFKWPSPPLTNLLISVTGSGLEYSATLSGPWTKTGVNNLTFTNPVTPMMFFRGTNSLISTKWF